MAIAFPQLPCYIILCCVCKQLIVISIVCRFHNHGQQVRTVSVVETPLRDTHLQSTTSSLLKMGILYSKDRPRSRSESRPSQRQLAQKHKGGNGLILPSHMQSQPTREAMWQSEDPERLHTYMKVSAMPPYRTLPGENEEKNVTFLLPNYNRTWALGSRKIHKLKPQPCLLPYLQEPFNSSSNNAATSSTSGPSKPS